MRISASAPLLFAALALAGCPEKTQEAALPPAGLAGGAAVQQASPHGAMGGMAGMGAAGAPSAAVGGMAGAAAASQPAAPQAARPHPPMGTVPGATAPAANAPASQPAATVIPGGGAAAVAGAAEVTGTVAEAHHVKEYTYLLVKDAAGNGSWAAVLKDESIGVGTKVSLGKDIWMTDFQSPSLNKTFDRILFGRVLSKQ